MANRPIGLDARMWEHPGIGRYIRELSGELLHCLKDEQLVFLGHVPTIKDFTSSRQISPSSFSCIETRSKIYSLQEQWEIPRKSSGLSLLHVPHFNVPVFARTKLVVTIHDLIYLHEPRASRSNLGKTYVQWLIQVIAKKAAAVITVSQSTKNDLLNQGMRISPDRIFVTHEAPSALFKKISDSLVLQDVKRRHLIAKPFVLFVGTLKPHKNVPMLIRAMEVLRKRGVEHELVLVGRNDARNRPLLKLIAEHSFVRYLGELSDEDLAALYSLAAAFVLPSFYEGFGLPVVEAMACGTPVLVSNRSSLPEIVGSAGTTFDPLKVDALSELLYNILYDEEHRNNLIKIGLERSRQFSWRKTAEQTMAVYRQVMN